MHFVPSHKMKNKSRKRLALRERALKSSEPSILYWNSFYSILDSWSTIWASNKSDDPVRLPLLLKDNS